MNDNEEYLVDSTEIDWYKSFALLPHRTITKKWVWLQTIYVRRIWIWSGVTSEPINEYATLFEILSR
ncbi:MAG TPA: hypothetical protein VFM18_18200 [Methanosarcina sp.]|nr:hypothetical protein [Methanosarcina sp.]